MPWLSDKNIWYPGVFKKKTLNRGIKTIQDGVGGWSCFWLRGENRCAHKVCSSSTSPSSFSFTSPSPVGSLGQEIPAAIYIPVSGKQHPCNIKMLCQKSPVEQKSSKPVDSFWVCFCDIFVPFSNIFWFLTFFFKKKYISSLSGLLSPFSPPLCNGNLGPFIFMPA